MREAREGSSGGKLGREAWEGRSGISREEERRIGREDRDGRSGGRREGGGTYLIRPMNLRLIP
jgi:hypothetical protein